MTPAAGPDSIESAGSASIRLAADNAAGRSHDGDVAAVARGRQAVAQVAQIALHARGDVGVERGGEEARVLAVLRQHIDRGADQASRQRRAQQFPRRAFMRRIGVAVDEADRDRLVARCGEAVARPPSAASSSGRRPSRRQRCARSPPGCRCASSGVGARALMLYTRCVAAADRSGVAVALRRDTARRAPLRSSAALVATVEPCASRVSRAVSIPDRAMPDRMPSDWSCTVLGIFSSFRSLLSVSYSTRSVKVPPTSIPSQIMRCPKDAVWMRCGGLWPRRGWRAAGRSSISPGRSRRRR